VSLVWGREPEPAPKPSGVWVRCTRCGGRGTITVTWSGDVDECPNCDGDGGRFVAPKEAA
jgi:DnaJ-class molecular chaperone